MSAIVNVSFDVEAMATGGNVKVDMDVQEKKATKIDGTATAKTIREEIKVVVDGLVEQHNLRPGLAVVIVGERKDSQTYVNMKKKAAAEVGFHSVVKELPATVTQADLEAEVKSLNDDPAVHAILVQLPLPEGIDEEAVLAAISLGKDVDGFHPLNMGRLCMKGKIKPTAVPCTPKGCIELLERYNVEISGKHAVVIGRSNIVGIPAAHLLLERNATVTICHSRTKDLKSVVRTADIVVAAVGRAEMVRKDWIKPGAVVIDIGINSIPDASKKSGQRLVGDCCTAEMYEVASMVTPVPGGVGPMTIAMLLGNTIELAKATIKEGAAKKELKRDFMAEKMARKVAEMPDVEISDTDLAAMRAKAKAGANISDEEKKARGLLYDASKASAVRDEPEEDDEGACDFNGGFDWE